VALVKECFNELVPFFRHNVLKKGIITNDIAGTVFTRFQQYRETKQTLAFVKKPLTACVEELQLSPFGVDPGALQLELLDLKSKELWSSKFIELTSDLQELEKKKCQLSSEHKWSKLHELENEDVLILTIAMVLSQAVSGSRFNLKCLSRPSINTTFRPSK